MKLNGFVGKGTGKLGSSVFAVSGGAQIVRQYNPQVANPQTSAQVEQRAKLKLMSQIAAALAPGLGFKKNGLVSARNQFIAKNIGLCTYENGVATVEVRDLHIAPGQVVLQDISVSRSSATVAAALIPGLAAGSLDRVIYVVANFTVDDKLAFVGASVAEEGNSHNFAANITVAPEKCVCFAYGVKFNSASARIKFDEYIADAESNNAVLETVLPSMISSGSTTDSVGTIIAASN